MALIRFKESLNDYIKNKNWLLYLPFWVFGLYLFISLLGFKLGEPSPSFAVSVMQSLNFFLHETSHLVFGFAPPIITALAGSGSEILLGLGLIVGAFLTRSYFASIFCFLWFMLATQATADYMADAPTQSMPLVSFGGGDPTHDWNFIFSELGLLEHSGFISGLTRSIGIISASFGLLFAAYLMIRMAKSRSESRHQERMEEVMNQIAQKRPQERKSDERFVSQSIYPTPTRGQGAEEVPSKNYDGTPNPT